MTYPKRFKKVTENKHKGWKQIYLYRRLQKRNRCGSDSDHWKPRWICITARIQLYIHGKNTCNTPSSEYICNERKELHYIHRLEKLTLWYLVEGLPVHECEMCHSHAMNVKHLLTDCANLACLRLRCFDCSNPNTLKQILGKNNARWNTVEFLQESKTYNRA